MVTTGDDTYADLPAETGPTCARCGRPADNCSGYVPGDTTPSPTDTYADLRATLNDPDSSASALRDAGFALLADLDGPQTDSGSEAADSGLLASDPTHDRGTNRERGGEPSLSAPVPESPFADLDAAQSRGERIALAIEA